MKKFLTTHVTALLIFLVVLFLTTVISYFVWGVGYLVTELNQANNGVASGPQPPGFDLKGAAGINYKGLISQPVATGTVP